MSVPLQALEVSVEVNNNRKSCENSIEFIQDIVPKIITDCIERWKEREPTIDERFHLRDICLAFASLDLEFQHDFRKEKNSTTGDSCGS